jgi:hypothetical protein
VASGPWRCLNKQAASAAPAGAQADVRVQACSFVTNCTTPVHGLTANLCDKKDVGCNSPRQTGITTDDNGVFDVHVPTVGSGFDGYLQVVSENKSCTDAVAFGTVAGQVLCGLVSPSCDINHPDQRCYIPTYAPAMLFFNPPIVKDVSSPLPLQLIPTASLPSIIGAAGIQIDQSDGNLLIQALDCDGMPAAGVTYKLPQGGNQASPLYVDNGVVSSTVTQTDISGIGGFARVLPGFASAIGYNESGEAVGEIGVQTAASTLTYGTLLPPSDK